MGQLRVPIVMWALAGLELALTAVAELAGWPGQFMSDRQPPDGGFLGWAVPGTALSAPLVLIGPVVVAGICAPRAGTVGWLGIGMAAAVAVAIGIGSLGETLAADSVTTPRPVLVGTGLVGLAIVVLVAWAVRHDVRVRRSAAYHEHQRPVRD